MIPVYIVTEKYTNMIIDICEDEPGWVYQNFKVIKLYVNDMSELVRLKNAI